MTLDRDALGAVARQVLETAAFLFCDEVSGVVVPEDTRVVEARIQFEAPVSGEIALTMPRTMALDAAANLLGVDRTSPEAEESAHAAVGELLNIIGGSALAAWFGAGTSWNLGLPRTSEQVMPFPSSRSRAVAFMVDDLPVEIIATEVSAS